MNSCRLLKFFKINLYENSFRKTIRVSTVLDPDDRPNIFFRPVLGQNCLQRLSTDDNSRQKVKCFEVSS